MRILRMQVDIEDDYAASLKQQAEDGIVMADITLRDDDGRLD